MDKDTLHYLDNSATTRVCPEAAEKIAYMLQQCYGNPSSLYSLGLQAQQEMTAARRAVADRLRVEEEEILFTSGGTESDNMALFGAAYAGRKRGSRIITTAAEHPAVLRSVERLEKEGFEVLYAPLNPDGTLDAQSVLSLVNEKTILVSVMAVNNETGAVFPIKEIGDGLAASGAPAVFHVDAVQAFGKLPLSPKTMGVDLLSISAHKIHGPKGVGALYIQKKLQGRMVPRTYGGGQEKNLRPGTESTPLIAGFGAAVKALPDLQQELQQISLLRQHLLQGLEQLPQVSVHLPANAMPYIVNFSAGKIKAETMLHFLESRDVFVSSGSACGRAKPSHVLAAMGLPSGQIASALRVSFSRMNTVQDVDALLQALQQGLQTLRAAR